MPVIKRLFLKITESFSTDAADNTDSVGREVALRMATAVLMIDVARADHVFEESEFKRVLQLIESHFALTPEQSAELFNAAGEEADVMVSLHDFIQLLNKHLDDVEKARIIFLLWEVAYADGRLDKYEDALVLRIGDLLYVSRSRVMRLKHDALQSASP